MQIKKILGVALMALSAALFATITQAEEMEVKITEQLDSITVQHNGKDVVIMRNQNEDHKINPLYLKTSRHCPPFCISPISLHPEIETIGELEVLDYLSRTSKGEPVVVVDSRTPEWILRGTIPGSVNIPWIKISPRDSAPFETAEVATRDKILTEQFGGKKGANGKWDFSNAKTLVLFCNGIWCGQSAHNIHTLVNLGYPPIKLKWYRGGMQDWEMVGLTTVK